MKRIICAVLILVVIVGAAVMIERAVYPFGFKEEIETSAAESGLPPALIASLIRAESRYRPRAVSNKGASGLMQLMPDTAAEQAAELAMTVYDLTVPADNIRIGCHYLSRLLAQFGHTREALAAYNAGASRVKEWLADAETGAAGRLVKIPFSETRLYCDRIERALKHYERKF